jgi:cell division inhibitor SepF
MDSARDFLGLGEDPYYDDDHDIGEEHGDPFEDRGDYGEPQRTRSARHVEPEGGAWDSGGDGGVRMLREEPEEVALVHPPEDSDSPRHSSGQRETRRRGGVASVAPAPGGSDRGVVRPLPTTNKPEVVSPTRFDDVQAVADAFKKIQPVIINLQGVDRDLSRRLIDFASGLCYGLEGEMERVTEQVFLLTPRGAEVSEDDRKRLSEGHLRDYDS